MQIYNELSRVANKYYPQEGAYCTVIALAVCTGMTFGKARSYMFNEKQRVNRKGSSVNKLNAALTEQGYTVKAVHTQLFGKTLITAQRAMKGSTQTYLIYTAGHVTVVKNGVCEDWANNEHGRPTRYAVQSIYEVTA